MSVIIDFHAHILPEMDDGSENMEMSEQMLKVSKAQGIGVIAATPHFYAGQMTLDNFLKRRDTAYANIYKKTVRYGVRLLLGAETAFFSGIGNADGIERLVISDTSLFLLEMPFREWNSSDMQEVEKLTERGLTPVIAHVERFFPYQKGRKIFDELYSLPVLAQVNAEALLNWRTRRLALNLFGKNMAHLLGSDCHNVSTRPPNLAMGRKIIERKLGGPYLARIDRIGMEVSGLL